MGVINVLSFEVANLIAAGEVVDRPASAIKEMIENSIDAGARRITVEIHNGGISFMRISDDGCGMEPEDMPLAIKRHATSKIRTAEDLDGICTLGFRGEALAAISAVSKVRIISKPHHADIGAELVVNCGEIVDFCERGCSNGTTIIVEDLFANVPARRKFLKRDVTETTAVCANVEKIALSHPEIAFRLICDGQIKLDTAGDGKLMSAIYAVFGRDFSNRLLEVNSEFDGISVKGYIGRPDNVKSNRNYQNFYINKRYVKSRTANAAIEQAYVSYLQSEKFPVCVLFIAMNPGRVDVNVHPAKLEVKFSNEKPVFEAIYYAVKQTLESNTARPEMSLGKNGQGARVSDAFVSVERTPSLKARQITMELPRQSESKKTEENKKTFETVTQKDIIKTESEEPANDSKKTEATEPIKEAKSSVDEPILPFTVEEYIKNYTTKWQFDRPKIDISKLSDEEKERLSDTIDDIDFPFDFDEKNDVKSDASVPGSPKKEELAPPVHVEKSEKPAEVKNEAVQDEKPARIEYRIVGEVFNSYIIVELSEKMLIIDKHAAHERIIFEQLKKNMLSAEVSSQLLMLPVEVMLMSDEVATIEEYRTEIEAVGFEFSSSRNLISVSAIPVGIEQSAVADMFGIIADRIKNGTGSAGITRNIVFEKALYQASCKAAIKAGREYPAEYQKWVVEKLMEIPDITFCPHGRPVAMELSKNNINRQFERS